MSLWGGRLGTLKDQRHLSKSEQGPAPPFPLSAPHSTRPPPPPPPRAALASSLLVRAARRRC
eukprot:930940-Rhodomonas_salina.2